MVNSCAGRMGHAAAEAVVKAGLELVPFTFTGESMGVAVRNIGVSGIPVYIVDYKTRQKAMDEILEKYPNLIMIDYTLPAAVNDNAQFYLKNQVPFVMGTSGGDREKLLEDVAAGNLHAVIAPQMGKQIVAFQAMMAFMGDSFPGVFSSYRLQVVESHQRTKVDTSGTAKAIVRSFQDMGVGFELSDIERIRSPSDQLHRMKVPEAALDGHAFHTYRLTSPDGSVAFEFQHNVCGRAVYAEGTVDAALFLAQKIAEGGQKRLFNMIDVLRAGSMR